MTEAIKKDKRREPFNLEKIRRSIETASREAMLSDERVKEVVEQVSKAAIEMAEGEREIETSRIRERVLKELDAIEPTVSKAWRNFDQTKSLRG